jgi:hypothetical protein
MMSLVESNEYNQVLPCSGEQIFSFHVKTYYEVSSTLQSGTVLFDRVKGGNENEPDFVSRSFEKQPLPVCVTHMVCALQFMQLVIFYL